MIAPTLAATAVALSLATPALAQGDAKAGAQIYQSIGCWQCHGVQGQGGGRNGPKLAPQPLPRDAIAHQLREPRDRMPVYSARILSESQLDDIVAYLLSIPPGHKPADIPLLAPQSSPALFSK